MDYLIEFVASSWGVLAQMAPYLLFGFLMSGILSIFISPEWIERHLGGRGFVPIMKSGLFGVPLPLCSCGVIPVTASLYKHGASRGATASFLLSTPTTGVDSILATYGLLGPVFAVFRPVVALISGVVGGGLVSLFGEPDATTAANLAGKEVKCSDQCCTEREKGNALGRALRYGFVTLPADIARSLLVGVAVAALITTVVQENYFAAYLGGGILSMLAMMAVGIPIYVCATASIPLAIGFMHMGASPGAALAFLVAGPATNAATIVVVWKVLGKRTTLIYLLTVAGTALAAGFGLDFVFSYFSESGFSLMPHVHEHGVSWFGHLSAVVLLAVLVTSLLKKPGVEVHEEHAVGEEAGSAERSSTERSSAETIQLEVGGMTCSHCLNAVTRALNEVAGVGRANVDLDSGAATVTGSELNPDELAQSVRDLGYDVKVLSSK